MKQRHGQAGCGGSAAREQWDHCRVSSDGSKIRSVYGETHSAFGRENGLDAGQTGCQKTNYKAVAVSRQEMPACPKMLGVGDDENKVE